jgi:hypothetical protein
MRRAAIGLFLLAPWTAECSWGGFTLADFPVVVAILAPLYGGAAVLIREVTRRAGRGWPTIVLLAAAFGFVQAGLVDQSLLNPEFLDDTEFRDLATTAQATVIPGLGISAEQVLDYVGNHIALSIAAPIALVESLVAPQRRHEPWLGRPGLAIVTLLYLGGSLLIYADTAGSDAYAPRPVQVTVVVGVILVLVGAAFAVRPQTVRSGPQTVRAGQRAVVHPLVVGGLVAVAHLASWPASGWAGVALRLAVATVVVVVVVRWSRRPGWGQAYVLAAWGAGLVVAAGTAYLVPTYAPAPPHLALASDIAISIVTAAMLGVAAWRLRRHRPADRRETGQPEAGQPETGEPQPPTAGPHQRVAS